MGNPGHNGFCVHNDSDLGCHGPGSMPAAQKAAEPTVPGHCWSPEVVVNSAYYNGGRPSQK